MADPTLTLPPPPSEMVPGDAPDPLAGAPLPVLPPGVPQPMSFADIMAGMQGRIAELPRPSEAMAAEQAARSARERQGATLETSAAEQDPKLRALERAYEGRGAQIAAMPAPEAPALPPPPSRGLRAFLATAPDESPEATLQKVMAGVMALATSMGGLVRGDGRTALAALSGAMQGWHEGDKERADRSFADWKAKTDQMLTNYNLERQTYDDAIKAGNLPLEMQKTALLIGAQRWDNAKAMAEFGSGSAEKWAQFVGAMSKEGNKLSEDVGKLALMKEEKDAQLAQQRDLREQQLALDREKLEAKIAENALKAKAGTLTLKDLDKDVSTKLATMPDARPFMEAGVVPPFEMVAKAEKAVYGDKLELTKSQGLFAASQPARTSPEAIRTLQDLAEARSYVAEMARLSDSGTVRLDKLMGGVRPFINQKILTGVVGPVPLPQSFTSQLNADELRMLSLVQDYADKILRVRSGAAITDAEFERMKGFIPEQSVTPQVFRARLGLQEDILRSKHDTYRAALEQGGQRAPDLKPQPLYSGPPAGATKPAEWTYNPKTGKLEKAK